METQVQGKSQSGQVKSAKNYFQRTEVGERDGGEGGGGYGIKVVSMMRTST